jgi:ABC-type branched-subunit amino acid transport system ATPase component
MASERATGTALGEPAESGAEDAPVAAGLEARDIGVRFGGLVALEGVSIAAPPGRITALIGPNGAGKTTMFNVCGGFLTPETGTVHLNGRDISRETPERRARLGIGRTFQRMQLFASMTVRENISMGAEAAHVLDDPITQLGLAQAGRRVREEVALQVDAILEDLGIAHIAGRRAAEVSTGQGRLVELGRALARRPLILMLDEPSSGLDPSESQELGELLRRLVIERGVGILMVEHDMALVLDVCEWIFVIDFGRPLVQGSPAQVRNSEEVRAAYLGSEAV